MSGAAGPALTPEQLEALHVLSRGMASRGPRTESDLAAGIHCVNARVANLLVAGGFARDIHHWRAVEITDAGLKALGGYAHLRSVDRPSS